MKIILGSAIGMLLVIVIGVGLTVFGSLGLLGTSITNFLKESVGFKAMMILKEDLGEKRLVSYAFRCMTSLIILALLLYGLLLSI